MSRVTGCLFFSLISLLFKIQLLHLSNDSPVLAMLVGVSGMGQRLACFCTLVLFNLWVSYYFFFYFYLWVSYYFFFVHLFSLISGCPTISFGCPTISISFSISISGCPTICYYFYYFPIGKNHKGAIATMDERKTKLRLAVPLPGKKAKAVKQAMIGALKPLRKFVKTITYDNGKEFVEHEAIAKALACESYFATPYHSWERGQNENANGLLRQYFPKSIELDKVSEQEVIIAVDKLNNRPRKCLNYKTPYEAFEELTGMNARKVMGYALMT